MSNPSFLGRKARFISESLSFHIQVPVSPSKDSSKAALLRGTRLRFEILCSSNIKYIKLSDSYQPDRETPCVSYYTWLYYGVQEENLPRRLTCVDEHMSAQVIGATEGGVAVLADMWL